MRDDGGDNDLDGGRDQGRRWSNRYRLTHIRDQHDAVHAQAKGYRSWGQTSLSYERPEGVDWQTAF
jgi:hypothetical protein